MKKRFMSIILCAAMSVTILSGCSGGSKEASEAKDSGAAQSQVDESTEALAGRDNYAAYFINIGHGDRSSAGTGYGGCIHEGTSKCKD